MKTLFIFLLLFTCARAGEVILNFEPNDDNALPAAISKVVSAAYDLNKKGLEALDEKDYETALEAFSSALEMLPSYSDAENNRGVVYYRKGSISEAQRIWEALASKDPKYAIVRYNLGLICLHERNREKALRLFEQAVKENGRLVEALVRCGSTSLELGKKEQGVAYLRKAFKTDPRHPDSWSFLAYALIMQGDTSGAVALLQSHQNEIKALKLLGEIESNRKNSKKASQYLSLAVDKGADPALLVELATTQTESGSCKEAMATIDKYLSLKIAHTADAFLTGGLAAKECGNTTAALRYFSDGVKRFPSDPILAYNLGQVYFHLKKFKDAESVWNTMTDSLNDPSLMYLRAIAARKNGEIATARAFVEKALTMDKRAEYHDLLGVLYYQEKKSALAEEQFKKALALNPELRSAELNLALISRKGENLDATVDLLKNQIAGCSGDSCATLAFQLSIIHYHQKQIDKAVSALQTIKEADRDDRFYRHIALYYRELQEWDKSIAALETASKNFVLDVQTEQELAEAYLFAGYYNKAIDRFQSLIPKWTQNPWRIHYQIGYAWLEQNNLDEAKMSFERSIKSKADNVAARGLLAFVLNRQGNAGEARKLWERNLQEDPDNPSIWINMGLSLERERNYEEALNHYKKALQLNSSDKDIQINIGNACLGLGRFTDAIDAYSQALSGSKRNLAAYNLLLAALKKKDQEKARKMLGILESDFSGSLYARRGSAEMSLVSGDTAKARKTLESLPEKEDADWLSLAKIYAGTGVPAKARECIGKLSSADLYREEIASIDALIAFGKGDFASAMNLMRQSGDTSFAAQYNIALTAYNAKQYQQVIEITQRLSKTVSGSDRTDVCRLAGNASFALKKWGDAKQWYLQLSNVEANNAVVQYNLAVAFYNEGSINDAWKYYERAKAYDPSIHNKDIEAKYMHEKGVKLAVGTITDSVSLWYNSAVDLQQQGSDSAAEKLYRKVIGQDTTNSQAWNNLGAIYGKRGDIDNAEKAYFKAIEKRHDVPETYANLVNLYIELEEFKKARKWIIKGLGHNPDSEVLATLQSRIPVAEEEALQRKKEADSANQ